MRKIARSSTISLIWLAIFLPNGLASAQTSPPPGASPRAFRTGCTDRDLDGQFGFLGAGTVLASPVNGLAGPFSRVGIFISDGAGNLTFSSRAAFNGIHFHQDFHGTYTMRSDCTFIANIELPFSHPSITPFTLHSRFFGIMSDDGHEMMDLFINPPGVSIYGKARKTMISKCTARDLFGSYQLDLFGSTLDLGFPLPFNGAGRIEADGNGKLSGQVYFNSGGFAVPSPISGTYTVASDCTFELTYCTLGDDGRTCTRTYGNHGAFLDNGGAAYLIVTEPLTAIILGNLKLQ